MPDTPPISTPSPTSVMNFRPPSMPSKRNSSSNASQYKRTISTSSINSTSSNNSDSDQIINQLKRQVTTLEHEKASLEQELLNQINTVVFDKETMVETLQEKLLDSEKRYKEERKAHTKTKSSLRQQRFASCGDAKFEIFRLQDQVEELTAENERLSEKIAQLVKADQEKGDAEAALLSQFTLMEKDTQTQIEHLKKENASKLKVMEQGHAAAIADMERDLFQRHQQKLDETKKTHEAELAKVQEQKSKDSKHQQEKQEVPDESAVSLNRELVANLQEANNDLLRQVSGLGSQLLEAQATNFDLQSMIDQSKSSALLGDNKQSTNEADVGQKADMEALQAKLSQSEADNKSLVQSLEEQESTISELKASLKTELELRADTDVLQEKLLQSQGENQILVQSVEKLEGANLELSQSLKDIQSAESAILSQLEKKSRMVETLGASLGQQETANLSLRQSLEEIQQGESATIVELQQTCAEYKEDIRAFNEQLGQEIMNKATLQESLAENTSQLQSMKAKQQEDAATILSLRGDCSNAAEEVQAIQAELVREKEVGSSLKKSLEDLQQSYSDISTAEEKGTNSLSSMQAEKDALDKEIRELRSQLEEQWSAGNDRNAKLADLKGQNKELRKLKDHNEEWISLLQEESDKNSRLSDDFLQQLERTKETELSLQDTVKDQQNELSQLKSEIESKDDVIANLEKQVHELTEEVAHEQTTISELLGSLGEEEVVNSALQEKHSCTTDTIADLQHCLKQEKQVITGLKASLSSEENKTIDLQSSIDAKNEEVMRLGEENSNLLDRIDSMMQQLEDEQNMIQDLQTSLEEKDSLLTIRAEEQELTDNELLSLETEHRTLQTEAHALRDQLGQSRASISKLQETSEHQQSKISELEASQNISQVAAIDFQRDRLALLDRIGTLKGELGETKSQSEALRNNLIECEGMLSTLQASQDDKGEKIISQEETINVLRDREQQLLAEAHKQLEVLNIVKASLVGSQKMHQAFVEQHSTLRERLEISSNELKSEQTKAERLRISAENLSTALDGASANFEEQIDSLGREKELLLEQVSCLDSEKQKNACALSLLQDSLGEKNIATIVLLSLFENQKEALLFREGEISEISSQLQIVKNELEKNRELPSKDANTSKVSFSSSGSVSNSDPQDCEPIQERGIAFVESDSLREGSEREDPEEKFDALYCKTTVDSLQEQNEELRQELNELLPLRSSLIELENEKASLMDEINSLENQLSQKQANRSESKSSLEEQQMESIVKATLEDQTTREEAMSELHREQEELRLEISKLQGKLEDVQAARDDLVRKGQVDAKARDQLESQLKSEMLMKETLQDDLSKAKEAEKDAKFAMEKFEAECLVQNSKLQDEVSQASKRAAEAEKLAKETIEANSVARNNTENVLQDDLSKAQETAKSEQMAREKLNAVCIEQSNKMKSLQNELTRAKAKAESFEEQLENITKTSSEESRANTEATKSIKQELDDTKVWLEKSLDEVEDLRGKLLTSTSLVMTTEEKNQEHLAQINKLEADLQAVRENLAASVFMAKAREEKNQDFRLQIESLESDLFDTKQTLGINVEELERLQVSEIEKDTVCDDTRKVLESFKSAAEHWRQETDRLKSAKDDIVAKHMEREAKLKAAYKREISAYKSRVEEFESKLLAENLKLRGQIEELKKSGSGQEGEVTKLASDLESAKKTLAENQEDKRQLQAKLNALELKVGGVETDQGTLDEIKKEKNALEEKVRDLQERLGDYEADRLEKQLCEIEEQKEISKLRVELASEQKTVASCQKEIEHLESASKDLQKKCKDAQAKVESIQAARKVEVLRSKSVEHSVCTANDSMKEEIKDLKNELRRRKEEKINVEANYMEKLLSIERKHSALYAELEEKKREISTLQSCFSADDDATKTREDLLLDVKEITEKTIVQGRIIQTMQKKMDSLETAKEKFFYERRREIMSKFSQEEGLRKENTRLREKVRKERAARAALQSQKEKEAQQLESFANSLGSSMVSHLRKGKHT